MDGPLLFDGAFGTYISSKETAIAYPEEANISNPELVTSIHREYIAAGVNAVKTNTFGAAGLFADDKERLREIITAGLRCAREAARGSDVRVFADIGPVYSDGAEAAYLCAAEIFAESVVKDFLFETHSEAEPLAKAVAYIKETVPDATVIVSFAVGADGYTQTGMYYRELLDRASEMGADIVGLNCICGPVHMLDLLKDVPSGKYRLSAMPNASYPESVNGRTVYFDNPGYFAEKLMSIYALGMDAIGGCCGTTPVHIKKFLQMLKVTEMQRPLLRMFAEAPKETRKKEEFSEPLIAVELPAPADDSADFLINASIEIKNAGADFVTIPDSPLGKARANSVMMSSLVQEKAGIRAIPHVACRDRNQTAIKGDLIAGNIGGLSYVLAVTGDAVVETERGTKSVFGLNSFKLIEFVNSLNGTLFERTPYTVCAALNVNARNFDAELHRAERKLQAGAEILFTQPVFGEENLKNCLRAKSELGCRIIAGVMPVAGYKNAIFLKNEVPGIEIPDWLPEKLRDKDADETREISVGFAKKIVDMLGECDGYYIMTPLKKTSYSAALTEYIRGKYRK